MVESSHVNAFVGFYLNSIEFHSFLDNSCKLFAAPLYLDGIKGSPFSHYYERLTARV